MLAEAFLGFEQDIQNEQIFNPFNLINYYFLRSQIQF